MFDKNLMYNPPDTTDLIGRSLTGEGFPQMSPPQSQEEAQQNTQKWTGFFDRLQKDPNLQMQLYSFFAGLAAPAPNAWAGLSNAANSTMMTMLGQQQAGQPSLKDQLALEKNARENARLGMQGAATESLIQSRKDAAQRWEQALGLREEAARAKTEGDAEELWLKTLGQTIELHKNALVGGPPKTMDQMHDEAANEFRRLFGTKYPELMKRIDGDQLDIGGGVMKRLGDIFIHPADGKTCVQYRGNGEVQAVDPKLCQGGKESAPGPGPGPAPATGSTPEGGTGGWLNDWGKGLGIEIKRD